MDKYELLVKCDCLCHVLDDWLNEGECDLTVRIRKTQGCRVIETSDKLYAERILKVLAAADAMNIIKPSKVSRQ